MITFLIILPFILVYVVFGVWIERKVSAFIQDRYGPMEVGFRGLLQTIADLLKLLQKEDIVPSTADKIPFKAAPVIMFVAIFSGFATLPLAPGLIGSSTHVGLFFMISIISFDVIGFLLAGWASNNKYSLLGAMRGVAQIISYEVPMILLVLSVVMISQSLSLQEISLQQGILNKGEINYLFGIKALGININEVGGFLTWNVFRFPLLMIGVFMYFVAGLAESNRAPFDIPEAESELVAGFQTEYSGFRWSVIMLSEYAMMLLIAALGVILFLGSWNTPLPNMGSLQLATWTTGTEGSLSGYVWGMFWLLSKSLIWVVAMIWMRWAYPRLRVDQLMHLSWKILTPGALILMLFAAIWKMLMIFPLETL